MTEPWSKPTLLPAALAGLILCGCGAQKRVRTGACDAHRHVAALVTRYVVVYGSRAAPEAITTYYVCLRPAGKALDLGVDELGGLYGSDATTGGFYADGTYVAAQSSIGEATLAVCAQHSNIRRCTPDEHWITVLDTKNLRRARVPVYGSLLVPALVPFPVALALSPRGAVAWRMNRPVGTSLISDCAPNPSTIPISPSPASRRPISSTQQPDVLLWASPGPCVRTDGAPCRPAPGHALSGVSRRRAVARLSIGRLEACAGECERVGAVDVDAAAGE